MLVVFLWRLSDNKSPQVSRTRLSILADLNKEVAWMLSIHPLISNSFRLFSKPFRDVISTPITFDPRLPSFFLSFPFLLFFPLWSVGTVKYTRLQVLSLYNFFKISTWSGLLLGRRRPVSISKSLRIIMIIIIPLTDFSYQPYLMVLDRSLSDSKSPQVSWTLFRILSDLKNEVDWMVSICPSISNSFSPLTKPFGTVPSAPIRIGITVILMFFSFFCALARSKYFSLSFRFLWFSLSGR